jgi:hypothetical protein
MPSGLFRLLRKAAAITALSGLVAGGAIGLTAAPAAATGVQQYISATSWSYVDSAEPHTSFANPSGDAPSGTRVDAAGVRHTTKSYFTFDLSQFEGAAISSATLIVTETAAADCTSTATPQAWATGPADNPTWHHQPAELSQLTGFSQVLDCPGDVVVWDATQVVQGALNTGRSTATIALRLPDGQQADPGNWRSYDPGVRILVQGDHAPNAPTHVTVQNKACGNAPIYVGRFLPVVGLPMSAVISDLDTSDEVGAQFVFWPVNSPQQRTEIDSISTMPNGAAAGIEVPPADVADDTSYAMQVRGTDGTATGPWSPVCQFITELTSPSAPSVSSTQFPDNDTAGAGSGEPGTFVVTGGTDPNIVGIDYQLDNRGQTYSVVPDANHNANIQYTPPTMGLHNMSVWSVDRAGNFSPTTNYSFLVADDTPAVNCTPTTAYLDVPRQCTISPRGTDDVGYVYNFNGGPSTSATPAADGTATVSVTPTQPLTGGQWLNVQARLSNGNLTDTNKHQVATLTGPPTVTPNAPETIVGVPTQFTATATLPGASSVTYAIPGLVDPTTVPLGQDGTATFTITPPSSGFDELDVFTTNADGVQSYTTREFWEVDTNGPTVASDDYPEDASSGGVSVPGTFDFSSALTGVVSYTYTLDDAAPVTVPAGSDGTANVQITPLATDETLLVSSTFGDGTVSEQTEYDFYPYSEAPKVACNGPAPAGQPVSCTFTAVQPGAVSFEYSWNGEPDTSLAMAADGTGTVTLTMPPAVPGGPDQIPLVVTSVNNLGAASDPDSTTVYVSDN